MEQECNIDLMKYQDAGLYLLVDERHGTIAFTEKNIERLTQFFWNSDKHISDEVKKSCDFARCEFCPRRDEGGMCDAIKVELPLIEAIDEFPSYQPVTAIFKDSFDNSLSVYCATMQQALQYIVFFSLIYYCQTGKKYRKYFYGIDPMLELEDFAAHLYMNVYWYNHGDALKTLDMVHEMKSIFMAASKNQVKRLNMICKSDSLINAFALIGTTFEFMEFNTEQIVEDRLREFEIFCRSCAFDKGEQNERLR